MHGPPAQELGIGQPGNHPEHTLLLPRAKTRLETNEVPHPAAAVLHSELRDRIGLATGSRVAEAAGFHRPEAKRLAAPPRHFLDRHASLEVRDGIEVMALVLVRGNERIEERLVLLARERTVHV